MCAILRRYNKCTYAGVQENTNKRYYVDVSHAILENCQDIFLIVKILVGAHSYAYTRK